MDKGNLIELKTTNNMEDKKEKAISLMRNLIKDLENDNIDPEKVIVFLKWKTNLNNGEGLLEKYQFHSNIEETENLLGCTDLLRDKILSDCIR